MRITQIVPSLEIQHGGPSVSVPALAASLARLGHEVELLATSEIADATASIEGCVVRVFPREWPQKLCPSSQLRRYLEEHGTDILHSHGIWLRTLHYANRHARKSRTPHVISPRGMMTPWAWRHHRLQKLLAQRLVHPSALAFADGWHATSADEAEDIRALGFKQPVCVAPNGVAAPEPHQLEMALTHWRASCPDAFQRPTALFYSRFHPKKRVIELIDLWLAHAPRDWLLLMVGIPETYSVAQLDDYVHRHSGAGRVLIYDGRGAPAPYVAASLLLFPSHSENFGLVVAEALAHGLPGVVTDTTPWRGMHAAGHGWCVPWPQFPEAMKVALAEGPDRLKQRGSAARDWVVEQFSWEKCARLLAEFYARLARAAS